MAPRLQLTISTQGEVIMELKDQIRLARERKGLSLADVAIALNCSEQAVKYWEAGTNVPRIGALRKLNKLLDVTLSPTGEMIGNTPGFITDLKAETVDLAKTIEAMPPDIRAAVAAVIAKLIRSEGSKSSRNLTGDVPVGVENLNFSCESVQDVGDSGQSITVEIQGKISLRIRSSSSAP